MIVVIGSPSLLPADPGGRSTATGRAVDVARGATDRGSSVQLVGKIGDDPAGDALLLALADAGIGHVAILRDPARATPVGAPRADEFEPMLPAGDDDDFDATEPGVAPDGGSASLPTIDAGDLDLALRYLPDHQVVIVAERLDPEALAVVVADCSYVGAALAIILDADAGSLELPPAATAFQAPATDPDGVFGRTIGRFGAALEQGLGGAAALAQATAGDGWQPATG